MDRARFAYGLRRYPLAALVFSIVGAGFFYWSSVVDAPTFVFPFGHVSPSTASVVFCLVGMLATSWLALLTYARFVLRPTVILEEGALILPVGEAGLRTVTLSRGQVIGLREETTLGGWQVCRISSRQGEFELRSAHLPNDDAYERICAHLRTLRD